MRQRQEVQEVLLGRTKHGALTEQRRAAAASVIASAALLRDLARRAREASGPDQELAEAVARAIGWVEEGDLWWDAERSTSVYVLPAWTADLDAVARWVMPPSWQWHLSPGNRANAWRLVPPEADLHDTGSTPALSLLAAALEARAVMAEAET